MRYPVVLFDVGETLIGPSESFGAVYAAAAGELGLPVDAARAERALRRVWLEMQEEIPPGIDRYSHYPGGEDEYWARFSRRTLERAGGMPIDARTARIALRRIREAFRDPAAWRIYPDVRPSLEELTGQGTRLGIVSNWDSRLPDLLRLLDLDRYFEVVGVSHLERVEKPNAEFFHRVLARLQARPDQALHVGDVPELDLAGARAAGVDGLLIDRRGALAPGLGARNDLTDLPRIARSGDGVAGGG